MTLCQFHPRVTETKTCCWTAKVFCQWTPNFVTFSHTRSSTQSRLHVSSLSPHSLTHTHTLSSSNSFNLQFFIFSLSSLYHSDQNVVCCGICVSLSCLVFVILAFKFYNFRSPYSKWKNCVIRSRLGSFNCVENSCERKQFKFKMSCHLLGTSSSSL